MLNESGVINFKEINRYPIVKAGQKLFYIVHEKQGRPGIAYDGRSIEVKEAVPFSLMIGEGVDKIDDIDKETGQSKGYHLNATKTGVVVIDWNENNIPVDISIQDEIKIDRVDYSVGNIGSQLTCPISANIGVICNGFKIRVNGRIEGNISEGAEIITDNDAQIGLLQNGSTLTALKNIMITSSSGSQIQSKQGVVTVKNELIDSMIKAPEVLFENNNGLLTNNTIEVDRLSLKGLHYSGVNKIYFGKELFYRKNELIQSLAELKNNILELETSRKDVMGKLQVELKKMAGLIHTFPDLAEHLKSLFLATKAMDYPAIFKEMDSIQQRNNTRPVAHTRDYFEGLEKINNKTQAFEEEKKSIKFEINSIDQMMDLMELSIDGVLRKGAVIKIFNGHPDEENQVPPDYLLESQGEQATRVHLKGSYSRQKGFEFVR